MKRLWNDGWTFLKMPIDAGLEQAMECTDDFVPVDIPHDWLIYDTQNLYEDSTGWYRKEFIWHADCGRMFVTFGGVYMDSAVYVNGRQAGEWKYGYSSFTCELTEYLREGENEILVCARNKSPNSRWYSGAGIYRNVWMRMVKGVFFLENGVYAHSEEDGADFLLTVETRHVGQGEVSCALRAKNGNGKADMELISAQTQEDGQGVTVDRLVYRVRQPARWDIETPNLYLLTVILTEEGKKPEGDRAEAEIGFRTIELNPETGFFLNGRGLKLNGVCEHHDLGALGAAFNKEAQRRKYRILKEMGVNAIRFAHNMAAVECLELADEMGFLVINEAFDMWEKPKTSYDYARFFEEWHARDMESFVTRDRNYPCVAFYSIGNEIYDTHADAGRGAELIKDLMGLVRRYDPMGNAYVTFGSNYMPWENTQKCAGLLEAVGYNYSERYYEEHHRLHPDWVIFGSETSSIVQSRGVYHFPLATGILSEDDEQCSALGNSCTSWSARSMEDCVCIDRDIPFSLGQFLWSGSDYIGEPTPYHTKNSYFGQIDTAGFPKDSYYVYQAAWTDAQNVPMVHVFPYWDFNPGQQIDVRVCSNAKTVELFVNGVSRGKQELSHAPGSGRHIIADYRVPYEEGSICAVAYDEDGRELCRQERHSFKDSARIVAKADKTVLRCDGRDMLFIEIGTVDKDGYPVENAADRIRVEVTGAGRLVGLDNGDSTDYDSYKGISRRLFNGRLLAMVMATLEEGEITIRLSGRGLEPFLLTCESKAAQSTGVTAIQRNRETAVVLGEEDEIPVRRILLHSEGGRTITPESGEVTVTADILPENATDREVFFRAVTGGGVTSNLVQVAQEGNRAVLTPIGDGEFRLRCTSKAGGAKVRLISELEFQITGYGTAYLNPYDFISGSLYTRAIGDVGAGNERGVATARDKETVVIFEHIDFGQTGSDEITVPVFALDDEEYPIQIWEGVPGEGGELLADVVYQKPSIWNVYQEETWKLSRRLTGITSISFLLRQKIHIKGFSFKKDERAYMRLTALAADEIYGDSFVKTEETVEQIGNNVSLSYHSLDFTGPGTDRITICGRAPQGSNTIHVRFQSEAGESKQIVEFPMCGEYREQTFAIEPVKGSWDVTFVFLPGSNFDFRDFIFGKRTEGE